MALENLSKRSEVIGEDLRKILFFFLLTEKKISKTYIISIDILLKRCIISNIRNRKYKRPEVIDMKNILMRLVEDFNEYSELVALNRSKMKEGKCDDSTLQWNRGHLDRIEVYLNDAADSVGVTLNWECKEHTFGYDDWKRVLTYRTVNISYEDLEKLGA
jgi:hypothetical protein